MQYCCYVGARCSSAVPKKKKKTLYGFQTITLHTQAPVNHHHIIINIQTNSSNVRDFYDPVPSLHLYKIVCMCSICAVVYKCIYCTACDRNVRSKTRVSGIRIFTSRIIIVGTLVPFVYYKLYIMLL